MSTHSIENIHVIQNTMDGGTIDINFVQSSIVPNVQPFDGLVVMIMPVLITMTD